MFRILSRFVLVPLIWLPLPVFAQPAPAVQSADVPATRTLPPGDVVIPPGVPMQIPDAFVIERNIPYDIWSATVLDVSYPKTPLPPSGKRPGVVMFHGGGWVNAGRAGKESMGNPFVIPYLEHGFVVCNVEYRVASQGLAPAAVVDARNAAKWFVDHADQYHVDVDRLVVTGASAGGHLALAAGMIPASEAENLGPAVKFAAIVDGYGIADVPALLVAQRGAGFGNQWLPDTMPYRDELARRVSPMTWVRKDLPPIYIFHGEKDNTAPVADAIRLQAALKAAGADAEIFLIPNAGHGPGQYGWPAVNKGVFEFLSKHGI